MSNINFKQLEVKNDLTPIFVDAFLDSDIVAIESLVSPVFKYRVGSVFFNSETELVVLPSVQRINNTTIKILSPEELVGTSFDFSKAILGKIPNLTLELPNDTIKIEEGKVYYLGIVDNSILFLDADMVSSFFSLKKFSRLAFIMLVAKRSITRRVMDISISNFSYSTKVNTSIRSSNYKANAVIQNNYNIPLSYKNSNVFTIGKGIIHSGIGTVCVLQPFDVSIIQKNPNIDIRFIHNQNLTALHVFMVPVSNTVILSDNRFLPSSTMAVYVGSLKIQNKAISASGFSYTNYSRYENPKTISNKPLYIEFKSKLDTNNKIVIPVGTIPPVIHTTHRIIMLKVLKRQSSTINNQQRITSYKFVPPTPTTTGLLTLTSNPKPTSAFDCTVKIFFVKK